MGAARVAIVGIGMTTSVGLSAPETAASVRAGTARIMESRFRDRRFDPIGLAQVPEDALTELVAVEPETSDREQRLLRLATRSLGECLEPFVGAGGARGLPLCLALPEPGATPPLDGRRFLMRLARQVGGAFDPAVSDASHAGRAGGIVALGQAARAIEEGRAEFVLVGGVDSYADPDLLGALDAEGRVRSPVNLDGFIPGEGAAFLLVARAASAAALGLAVVAGVDAVAVALEPGHLYSEAPYRGEGLAKTIAGLVAAEPIREIFSSMNGESHWAKEWGVGLVRNRGRFDPEYGFHHPAESTGDTGAACGPLMVGLASLGIKSGYRRSPAMVYGSSDRGGRAAVVVSAASR